MKLWLDDKLSPPNATWAWFNNAHKVIETLKKFRVEEISLDHDLGDEDTFGTGYMVMLWIEEKVHNNPKYRPPIIVIHTQNPVGRDKMFQSRVSIRLKMITRSGH